MKKKGLLWGMLTLLLAVWIFPEISYAAASFKITAPKSTMEYGNTQKLKAANNKKQKVTYKSSNTKVLSVSSSGVVKAKYPGKAKITATAGKNKSTVTIRVIQKVTDLKISLKGNTAYINQTLATNATVKYAPAAAARPAISYSIKNPSIAKVDQYGKIKGLKEGKTTLTLKAGLKSKSFPITVKYGDVYWTKPASVGYNMSDISWSQNDTMFNIGNEVFDSRNGKLIKKFDHVDIHFYHDGLGLITENGMIELYSSRLQEEKKFQYDPDVFGYYAGRYGKYSMRYMRDGNVIFNDNDETVRANLNTEEIDTVYKRGEYSFGSSAKIELTPDEQTVAIAYGREIYFFDQNGKEKEHLTFDGDGVKGFAFSPDGQYMTVVNAQNSGFASSVDVINLDTALIDYSLEDQEGTVSDLAYSPNGKYLAVGGQDGVVHLYSTADYTHVKSLVTPYNKRMITQGYDSSIMQVSQLSFSHDGKKLLALYYGYGDNNAYLWNTLNLK